MDCKEMGKTRNAPIVKICPWDDIPQEKIIAYRKQPLKQRTKTFEELRQSALDGIMTYWSRRHTNTDDGTFANEINWEVIVNAVQDEKGMKAPNIIFFTNSNETNFTRSHNWELSRKLFYKIGYLKYDDWVYLDEGYSSIDFPETSAHEIGHEILLAYGGQLYSKKHKNTSTIMQSVTNKDGNPKSGEIDLMKYYDGYSPSNSHSRIVASKEDVLGLVWLSKIKLK